MEKKIYLNRFAIDLANFRKEKTEQQFMGPDNHVYPIRLELQMRQRLLAHAGIINTKTSSGNHVYLRTGTCYGIIDDTVSDQ